MRYHNLILNFILHQNVFEFFCCSFVSNYKEIKNSPAQAFIIFAFPEMAPKEVDPVNARTRGQ